MSVLCLWSLFGIYGIYMYKVSAKNKRCFNCSYFLDIERVPKKDNRRKGKKSGEANIVTRSSYDLCEVY